MEVLVLVELQGSSCPDTPELKMNSDLHSQDLTLHVCLQASDRRGEGFPRLP